MLLWHVLDTLEAVEVGEVVGTRVQTNIETIVELTDNLVARPVTLREQVLSIDVASAQRIIVRELHQLRLALLRVLNLHVLVQSHMLLFCLVILALHTSAMRRIQAAGSEHHAGANRNEDLELVLHVELAVDHCQRHIVITLGIVHHQVFGDGAIQMLTEQVARILVLERFVNTIITAARAGVQAH